MSELTEKDVENVIKRGEPCFVVRLLHASGSTPRDAGALMLVTSDNVYGTIGGGSAEWVVILAARSFIDGKQPLKRQTVTLGPEIDQCCGGTIEVSYSRLGDTLPEDLHASLPPKPLSNALIFGAGHTGIALANALSPLALSTRIIDSRKAYEKMLPDRDLEILALPETAVRSADKGAIFVVTTHDHSLDFLITAEALARKDAAYVGMIGSPTKRAVLKSWLKANDYDPDTIDKLHCPIGGTAIRNKQPEVIAAMTIAEIIKATHSKR